MHELTFGFSLLPTLDLDGHVELVTAAETAGLDLVGIQDHPYVPGYLDTFVLAGALLARTSSITVFPDVANLPLRPPAMLAKTAAALDLVSEGRFELALGAGGYWDAITGLGVPRQRPAEANAALEEAIAVVRALWRPGGDPVWLHGDHYSIQGAPSGPVPAHPIEIWTGAQGPNALRLTGRIADGWAAPIASYLPYQKWAKANLVIDDAARSAGRDPRKIRRIAQLVGTVVERPGASTAEAESGAEPIRGTARQWAELIARLASEQPFTSFVFWPQRQTVDQVARFAAEVVPAARALLGVAGTAGHASGSAQH